MCVINGCLVTASPKSKKGYCQEHARDARQRWVAMIKEQSVARDERNKDFANLFRRAHEAGMAAGHGVKPTPMVVYSPKEPFVNEHAEFTNDGKGGLLVRGDGIDESKPVYVVGEGVCGFAWVIVRPGNCPFANWLKKTGKGKYWDYDHGVGISVGEFGQSYERSQAYAGAFAAALQQAGIKASAGGRLD